MALPKGRTNNPKGRVKGSKNKRTKEWEALGEAITGKLSTKLQEELNKLEGEAYIKAVSSILQYFKPKMAATTLDAEIGLKSDIVIEVKPKDSSNGLD